MLRPAQSNRVGLEEKCRWCSERSWNILKGKEEKEEEEQEEEKGLYIY